MRHPEQPDAGPPAAGLGDFLDRISHGDCVTLLERLPAKSVDLIFADPPYNLQLENQLLRPNQTVVDGVDDHWDRFASFQEYDDFSRAWLTACRRVLKDDGTIWVIGSYHNIFRVGSIMMDLGYWFLNDIHWHKTNPMPNFRGTRFTNATETMIWAKKSKEQKRYTFNYAAMKSLNEDLQMRNVWEIPLCTGGERLRSNGVKAHSPQKPEALLFRVIMAASLPGSVVLDPFSGSGTTAAVARKLRRHFVGLEKEEAFVRLSQVRVEAALPVSDPALLFSPSKRHRERVKFGVLVECGLIPVGTELSSANRRHTAIVAADGSLRLPGGESGSIHRMGALAQGAAACNGWDFWCVEEADGRLTAIDALREKFRQLPSSGAEPQ